MQISRRLERLELRWDRRIPADVAESAKLGGIAPAVAWAVLRAIDNGTIKKRADDPRN